MTVNDASALNRAGICAWQSGIWPQASRAPTSSRTPRASRAQPIAQHTTYHTLTDHCAFASTWGPFIVLWKLMRIKADNPDDRHWHNGWAQTSCPGNLPLCCHWPRRKHVVLCMCSRFHGCMIDPMLTKRAKLMYRAKKDGTPFIAPPQPKLSTVTNERLGPVLMGWRHPWEH